MLKTEKPGLYRTAFNIDGKRAETQLDNMSGFTYTRCIAYQLNGKGVSSGSVKNKHGNYPFTRIA